MDNVESNPSPASSQASAIRILDRHKIVVNREPS